MAEHSENNGAVRVAVEPAQGYYDLGLYHEAWTALDNLTLEEKGHPLTTAIRLDILLALNRYEDAVALGTGAVRQWPHMASFYLGTASALMTLDDHEKARELLLAAPCVLHAEAKFWFTLARCQGHTGDVDGARKSLWECINRDKGYRALALDDPDFVGVWKTK